MASPLPPPDECWASLGTCSKIRYNSDQVSTEAAGSSDREKHRKGRGSQGRMELALSGLSNRNPNFL